jgi:PAS domain S-box-containing protein
MNQPIRILHLEDSRFDAEIAVRELKISDISFERLWVTNKNDFRKALQEFSPDIILSDHSLPSFSSVQAMKMLKEMGINVPFILITGTISEEFAVNILKQGASDYLLKDNMQRLPEAIKEALKIWQAEKKHREYLEELEKNEHRFRALIENMSLGVVLLNTHADVIYQNPAASLITGLSRSEMQGLNAFDLIYPDDLPGVLEFFHYIYAKPGNTAEKEYRTKYKTDQYVWIEATVSNMLHDHNINALMVHFRDISKYKTM